MPIEKVFVVDRVVGGVAVLVGDDGSEFSVGVDRLPVVSEGNVLRVPVTDTEINWARSSVDVEETTQRTVEGVERLRRLRGDPGQDISI